MAGGRCARLGKLSARSAWLAPRAARSTRTLGVMNSMLEPDSLFRLAGIGMALHVACSAWLRSKVEPGTALVEDLFGRPALAHRSSSAWLLRGRYFLPWVPAPAGLNDYDVFARLLFVGARLGALLLVAGFMGFLVRVFWDIGHT